MAGLGKALGLSGVSSARLSRVISAEGAKGALEQGWGLFDIGYCPSRPRSKVVRINSKGREVVDKFLSQL